MRKIIPLMLASTLMTTPAMAHMPAGQQPGVIHVTASASADAVPDRATVSAGVQSEAPTAQEAMMRNSEQMRRVFATLQAQGIPERDVSTSSLNLSPRYNYETRSNGQPQLVGYQASNQVMVTTRNLDAVGPLIDALISAGVNNINNVAFSVANSDAAHDSARTEAIEKAQVKAQSMANAANVRLGRLLSLTEGGSSPSYQPFMGVPMIERQAASAAPPLAPGQREISATVTLTYEIVY